MSQDRIIGFQTSSLYHFDADAGLSERFKSRDLVKDQEGWHPHGRVFFVTGEIRKGLNKKFPATDGQFAYRLYFAHGETWTAAQTLENTEQPEDSMAIVSIWDRKTGEFLKAVPASLHPEIGMAPIEKTYSENGTSNQHLGSPIQALFTDERDFDRALTEASQASGVSLNAQGLEMQ